MRSRSLVLLFASLVMGGTLGYVTREPGNAEKTAKTPSMHQDLPPTKTTTVPAPPPDPARLSAQLETASKINNELPRCREIIRLIEDIPVGSLPRVLDKQIFHAGGTRYNDIARLLASRFAESDPHASLAWLTNRMAGAHHERLVATVFTTWSASDPGAARAAAESIADSKFKRAALAALDDQARQEDFQRAVEVTSAVLGTSMKPADIARSASIDPAEAAKRIAQFPSSDDRREAIGMVAATWAKTDRIAAFRWATQLKTQAERERAMDEILPGLSIRDLLPEDQFHGWMSRLRVSSAISRWAVQDPVAVARWLAAQPATPGREEAAERIAREWVKTDPRAAIDYLTQQFPSGEARDEILKHLAGEWAKRDPGAALDWAAALPKSPLAGESLIRVMAAWANRDPAAAAEYLRHIPPSPLKDNITKPIAETWAKVDPRAAVALANEISDTKIREATLESAIYSWTCIEPFAAAEYLYQTPTSEDKQGEIWSMCGELTEEDMERAVRWAAGFTNSTDRATALFHTMRSWAEENSMTAGAYALSALDVRNRDRIAPVIAEYWMRCDPRAAAAWAVQLPEGEGRGSCLRKITENWAHVDEPAAARWLEGLSTGPSRDAAFSVYVDRLKDADPAKAFHWSTRIQNDEIRRSAVMNVAMRWSQADHETAERAIRASSLPGQEKEMLLFMMTQKPGVQPF